ncbi:TPA: NUDIX hydrolase [Pseudomonas aeruginosa]|uniref:NUDIX hydrolase n=1 Tax=Pseudomonas aeruginosa TaxID=287 RepID=UPI0025B39889|nr:NUDIX hydrolase [Pseudomonas aeruginosa]MDN3765770.1 NUDIX hydrolase [Pseudomonas aeruginosa]HCR9779068.1 NUDIX hydrolase [Pseudomonas aeruginosa]
MWLFTKFGFFSVVKKGTNDDLTIRSRTRSDLDRIRNHYLPSLSASRAHEGTDYPWRATASASALAEAMSAIAQDIDYANFKDEVAFSLGKDRAKRYGRVWSALYDMSDDFSEPHQEGFEGLPWQQSASTGKAVAYGGVVIDPNGYLLMREVKNHFDGYVWTFAKGRQDKGESPRQTAQREVREEMGIDATILSAIPGEFAGGSTINRFFLMLTDRGTPDLTFGNRETERLIWATAEEAKRLIAQSTNTKGRQRDLAILQAALALLPAEPPLKRAMARRTDWQSKFMPAARVIVPLETRYSLQEMATIIRGSLPNSQDDKWFIFYEDGVLHCHRSWTGICIFRVHFRPCDSGWQAWQVEINRHSGQYTATDEHEDLALLDTIIEHLLIHGPVEPTVDGFAQALLQSTQPGYLGSPQVVGDLLQELFIAIVEQRKGTVERGAALAVIKKLSVIFSEDTEGYIRMPGWHSEQQLGKALVHGCNLDEDYCEGENLCCLVAEGLAALQLKIGELLRGFEADDNAQWERDALPQLNELHRFATAVMLGTNNVTHPGITLRDFS